MFVVLAAVAAPRTAIGMRYTSSYISGPLLKWPWLPFMSPWSAVAMTVVEG